MRAEHDGIEKEKQSMMGLSGSEQCMMGLSG